MPRLHSNADMWINLVTYRRGLRELAFLLIQVFSSPARFQGRMVSRDPLPDIFLHKNFTFEFAEFRAAADLAINRGSPKIGHGIRKPINDFKSRVIVMHAIVAIGMILDVPVRKIERRLQPVSDAVFKLVPEIEIVPVRLFVPAAVELPGDPVFEFKFPLLRGCNLIAVGEVTLGGGSRNARRDE